MHLQLSCTSITRHCCNAADGLQHDSVKSTPVISLSAQPSLVQPCALAARSNADLADACSQEPANVIVVQQGDRQGKLFLLVPSLLTCSTHKSL